MAAAGLVTMRRQQSCSALVGNIVTNLIIHENHENYTLMAKQAIPATIVLSGHVIPLNGTNGPRFEFIVYAGEDTFREAAEILAVNLGLEKPSQVHLRLADYNASVIMDLVDAFETMINQLTQNV